MRKSNKMFKDAFVATAFCVALGAASIGTTRAEDPTVAFRRAQTFEDAHAASCRVSVPGARGSGFFIGAVGKDGYVMTNYHVVTRSRDAKLDFWTNGRQETICGRIEGRYFDPESPADFALVVVDADALKTIDPPFLALGGPDARPSVDALIVSSGAPDGRFLKRGRGASSSISTTEPPSSRPRPFPVSRARRSASLSTASCSSRESSHGSSAKRGKTIPRGARSQS